MGFILQADNRIIAENAKFSFLTTNYSSAAATLVVVNSADFAEDDYVLLEHFGTDVAEIVQVDSIASATHTLTLKSSTIFAHSESTRTTIIPFNQVHFYHTTTTTFGTATPVAAASNIQANRWYSQVEDSTYTTGYGWFRFENSTTKATSDTSNYIPYAGFDEDTVKNVIDDFFSLFNDKDLKLITAEEALNWLNEAYSQAQNALNLVNDEYFASDETTLSITGGTQEYSLASDFSSLIYIRPSEGDINSMTPIRIRDIPSYLNAPSSQTRYYLRGKYIGFVPIPFEDTTYYYRYRTKQDEVTAYSDVIDLPHNGYYAIKHYMMGQAMLKLSNPNASSYINLFEKWISDIKISAVDRDDYPDRWSVDTSHWI